MKSKFSFRQIEESEVLKTLLRLNPNKASGVDGISSKLLRMVAPGICYGVTKLFNACLQSGCMPEEWKSANITPVHKQVRRYRQLQACLCSAYSSQGV